MYRFSIGRDVNCDVVLHGASVSRQHAFLTLRDDGSIQFEDANSTNGSYLIESGELVRISSIYLEPEASLRLGREQVSLAEIMQAIHIRVRRGCTANSQLR